MTAPFDPLDHLDDETLSASLDGEPAPAHLEACATCTARLAALDAARRAVAEATVPALPADLLDALVGRAVADAGGEAERVVERPVVARRGRRGRRLATPPPAWLLGAAAAIALLAGLAGLVRSTTGGDDGQAAMRMQADEATAGAGAGADRDAAGGTAVAGGTTAAGDPEVVGADLGDQDDPRALTSRLAAGAPAAAPAVPAPTGTRSAGDAESAGAGDRAQCRAEAERIGAGRLGALVSTSTLRWAGRPAEVLVFALTEPAGGVTRQALVLARPGCALLADPRF